MAYGDIVKIDGVCYKNITPNMISDTEPAPYKVICSSYRVYPEGFGYAFQSFADQPVGWTAGWMWGPQGNADHNPWIGFDFSVPVKVDAIQYQLVPAAPGMTFCGSNDGINYKEIFQRTNADGILHYQKFEDTEEYRFYRFYTNQGGWNNCLNLRFYTKTAGPFLINDANKLKSIQEGKLIELNGKLDKQHFENYGFTDLHLLDGIPSGLGNNFELLRWINEGEKSQIKVSFIPEPQLVIPTNDLVLDDITAIRTIKANTSGGGGQLKIAVSFDKGLNWYTHKDNCWQEIELSVDGIGQLGISADKLAEVTSEHWMELFKETLRFAYYLEKLEKSDDIALDSLVIAADTKGSWDKAVHQEDYKYGYASAKILRIDLLTDGSYKINMTSAIAGDSCESDITGATILPLDDKDIWLACIGEKSAKSLEDIVNDVWLIGKLMASENAQNYLVRCNNKIMNAVTSSQLAMTALGQSPYGVDRIIDNQNWIKAILGSDSAIAGLDASNPIRPAVMTSNTAPMGICRASSVMDEVTGAPWHAFDGVDDVLTGKTWSVASGMNADQWLEYEYPLPVFNYKMRVIQPNTTYVIKNLCVQYSDDGINYKDATERITFENNTQWHEYILSYSIGKHKYWRLFVYDRYGNNDQFGFDITEVQFYGK